MATFEISKKPNYPDLLSATKLAASGIKVPTLHSDLETLDKCFRKNPWLEFKFESEYKKHAEVVKKGEEEFNLKAFKQLRVAFRKTKTTLDKAIEDGLDNKEEYLKRMSKEVDKFVALFKKMEPLLEHEKNPQAVFKMFKALHDEIKKDAKPEKGGDIEAVQE